MSEHVATTESVLRAAVIDRMIAASLEVNLPAREKAIQLWRSMKPAAVQMPLSSSQA